MYDKLLICVTGAPNSLEVARVGLAVASRNAEVIFLHVEPELNDDVRKRADKELAHIRHLIMERPPIKPEFVIVQGEPKGKIIELANKNQMQVIVLGESPKQGEESISDFVLHHAKAAVIAVKSKNL